MTSPHRPLPLPRAPLHDARGGRGVDTPLRYRTVYFKVGGLKHCTLGGLCVFARLHSVNTHSVTQCVFARLHRPLTACSRYSRSSHFESMFERHLDFRLGGTPATRGSPLPHDLYIYAPRRGAHTRHTHKWDGLHTRHLLESTHTNTHKHTVHVIPRARALTPQPVIAEGATLVAALTVAALVEDEAAEARVHVRRGQDGGRSKPSEASVGTLVLAHADSPRAAERPTLRSKVGVIAHNLRAVAQLASGCRV